MTLLTENHTPTENTINLQKYAKVQKLIAERSLAGHIITFTKNSFTNCDDQKKKSMKNKTVTSLIYNNLASSSS